MGKMFLLRLGSMLFALLFTALPSLAFPNINTNKPSLTPQAIPPLPEAVHHHHYYDDDDDHDGLTKRQTNNAVNCGATCILQDNTLTAGNDACITAEVSTSSDPPGRGASVTLIGTVITAGRNININVIDRTANGRVLLWLEDVVLTAGQNITVNFGEDEGCPGPNCEVIIYMKNVVWTPGAAGVHTIDHALYTSRLDTGNLGGLI